MDGMLSLSAMDGSRSLAQARRGDVQIGHKRHRAFVAEVLSLHLGLSDPTHMLHYFRATPLASLKSHASTHDVRRPVSLCVLARRSPQNGEINADFSTPSSRFTTACLPAGSIRLVRIGLASVAALSALFRLSTIVSIECTQGIEQVTGAEAKCVRAHVRDR